MSERRYGFFRCPRCRREWESSLTWCYKGTNMPSSGQKCQNCPDEMVKPYNVDRLQCPECFSNTGCDCERDDRHVDRTKPHRTDLCERCQEGKPCYFSAPRRSKKVASRSSDYGTYETDGRIINTGDKPWCIIL